MNEDDVGRIRAGEKTHWIRSFGEIDIDDYRVTAIAIYRERIGEADRCVARLFEAEGPTEIAMQADDPEDLIMDIRENTDMFYTSHGASGILIGCFV